MTRSLELTGESLTSGAAWGLDTKASTPRRQASWSGPECPVCESNQTPVRTSGRDRDDRPLRARQCESCGATFTTIEQVVLFHSGDNTGQPVPFALVDVEHRRRKRENKRKKFGWSAGGAMLRTREVKIVGHPRVDGRRV